MADPQKRPIGEILLGLIEDSDLSLTQIAAKADVDYQALRRWVKEITHTYDVGSAEKVYEALTGKKFDS